MSSSSSLKEDLKPSICVLDTKEKSTSKPSFAKAFKPCLKNSNADKVIDSLQSKRDALLFQTGSEQKQNQRTTNTSDSIINASVAYLELVQGFCLKNIVVAKPASNSSVVLTENNNSPNGDAEIQLKSEEKSSLSSLFSFCEWKDLTTNTSIVQMNASQEIALTLLATGICLMQFAATNATTLLRTRSSDTVDSDLIKQSYRALIQAAGAFDACSTVISTGSVPLEKKTKDSSDPTSPTESEMEAWRQEQAIDRRKSSSSSTADMQRIGDFSNSLPSVLSIIALAAAQEASLFRAATAQSEKKSAKLMAQLSLGIAVQYEKVIGKKVFQSFIKFKREYYMMIAWYYKGLMTLEAKDDDEASACVNAIACFNVAIKKFAPVAEKLLCEGIDDDLVCKESFKRSTEIIKRDLDIASSRNQTIYFEKIPELSPQSDSISGISPTFCAKSMEFPVISAQKWEASVYEAFDLTKTPDRSAGKSNIVDGINCKCIIS